MNASVVWIIGKDDLTVGVHAGRQQRWAYVIRDPEQSGEWAALWSTIAPLLMNLLEYKNSRPMRLADLEKLADGEVG